MQTTILSCICAYTLCSAATPKLQLPPEYQRIIDRAPFGSPPLTIEIPDDIPPAPKPPEWIHQLKVTMLMENNLGLQFVGLHDLQTKQDFILTASERYQGITIESIDYAAQNVRLTKDGFSFWIPLQARPQHSPARLTGAALEKHLRQYQTDRLIIGLPSIPVSITPEMDEQLVREGVLPPRAP